MTDEVRRGRLALRAAVQSSATKSGSESFRANSDTYTKYKTQLCDNWVRTQSCSYGRKCQFAHGIEELRTVGAFEPSRFVPSAPPPMAPPPAPQTIPPQTHPPLGNESEDEFADDRSFRSRESFRGTTESHVSADIYEATGLEGIENYPVEEDPRELTTFFPFQSMEDRLEKVLYEYLESWEASGLGSLDNFSMPFTRLYVQLKKKSGYMVDVTKSKYKKFGRFLQEMERRSVLKVGMIRELHCVTEINKAALLREHERFFLREQRRVGAYQQRSTLVVAPTYPILSASELARAAGQPPPPEGVTFPVAPTNEVLVRQLSAPSTGLGGYRVTFHYRAVNVEASVTEFALAHDFGWGADVIGVWKEEQGVHTRVLSFATLPFKSQDPARTTEIVVPFRPHQLSQDAVYYALVFFEDGVTPVNGIRSYFRVYPYDGDEHTTIHVILECGYRPPRFGAYFLPLAVAEAEEPAVSPSAVKKAEYSKAEAPKPTTPVTAPAPPPTEGIPPHPPAARFQEAALVQVSENTVQFCVEAFNFSSVVLSLTDSQSGASYGVYMVPRLPPGRTDVTALGMRRFTRQMVLNDHKAEGGAQLISDVHSWKYFKRTPGATEFSVCPGEALPEGTFFVEFIGFAQHESVAYSPSPPKQRFPAASPTENLSHALHIEIGVDSTMKKTVRALALALPRPRPGVPPHLFRLPMADTAAVPPLPSTDPTQPHFIAPLPPPAESEESVHPTVPMGPLTADQVENIKAQVVRIQRSIEKLEKQKRILDNTLFHQAHPEESLMLQGGGMAPKPPPISGYVAPTTPPGVRGIRPPEVAISPRTPILPAPHVTPEIMPGFQAPPSPGHPQLRVQPIPFTRMPILGRPSEPARAQPPSPPAQAPAPFVYPSLFPTTTATRPLPRMATQQFLQAPSPAALQPAAATQRLPYPQLGRPQGAPAAAAAPVTPTSPPAVSPLRAQFLALLQQQQEQQRLLIARQFLGQVAQRSPQPFQLVPPSPAPQLQPQPQPQAQPQVQAPPLTQPPPPQLLSQFLPQYGARGYEQPQPPTVAGRGPTLGPPPGMQRITPTETQPPELRIEAPPLPLEGAEGIGELEPPPTWGFLSPVQQNALAQLAGYEERHEGEGAPATEQQLVSQFDQFSFENIVKAVAEQTQQRQETPSRTTTTDTSSQPSRASPSSGAPDPLGAWRKTSFP